MAAEWPAATNYLYLTYGGEVDDFAYVAGDKVLSWIRLLQNRIKRRVRLVLCTWHGPEKRVSEVSW